MSVEAVLSKFSRGELSRRQVMKQLRIEDYGSLILLMREKLLTLPRRPESVAKDAADTVASLLEESGIGKG